MIPSVAGTKEGEWKNPPTDKIDELLRAVKVVAVVGLSSNGSRPSYGVAKYLKGKGYRIVPVNPNEEEILGEKSYPDLKSIPFAVDVVDVFRRPEAALAIVEEAIAKRARAVWLQEKIISIPAYKRGKEAGLTIIMDRCMYKEHARMIGG